MALITQSLAGKIGSSIWTHAPVLGMGLSFGVGAGVYAGINTHKNDGSLEDSGTSAMRYAVGGTMAVTTAATALAIGSRSAGYAAGSYIRNSPARAMAFGRSLRADYAKGGFSRIAERKGLMMGLGAAVGAAIGYNIDSKNPEKGAAIGAGVGAVGGIALATGIKAARLWEKIGPVGRVGAIGALTGLAFAGAAYASRPKYASIDVAAPVDNGLRDRMNSMSATGDLVFGLHNSR